MGKAKDYFINLQCEECEALNYRVRYKKKAGQTGSLRLMKFCSHAKCRGHKWHKGKRS